MSGIHSQAGVPAARPRGRVTLHCALDIDLVEVADLVGRRLLANAYSVHIAHLTTGMRIGAAAAEKLDLFPVRRLILGACATLSLPYPGVPAAQHRWLAAKCQGATRVSWCAAAVRRCQNLWPLATWSSLRTAL